MCYIKHYFNMTSKYSFLVFKTKTLLFFTTRNNIIPKIWIIIENTKKLYNI